MDLVHCIKRAMEAWPCIDFAENQDGCLFTATIHRTRVEELKMAAGSPKTSGNVSGKILVALKQDGYLTIPDLAAMMGVTERSIEIISRDCRNRSGYGAPGQPKAGIWN